MFFKKRVQRKRCDSCEASKFTGLDEKPRSRAWKRGVVPKRADFEIASTTFLIGARESSKFTGLVGITSFVVHPFFGEMWF
jgi:hypothetical protein